MTGLETHYMHFTPSVFELAFRAIAGLLPQPYAAVFLKLPRSASDLTWPLLEQEPLAEKTVYVAGDESDLAGLVRTLRAKSTSVRTASELSTYLHSSDLDPRVLAAVEQVLLAAATSFYFTPDDSAAAPIIALRERLGIVGAAEDREVWTTHTHVSAADRSRLRLKPQPKCEPGPEE